MTLKLVPSPAEIEKDTVTSPLQRVGSPDEGEDPETEEQRKGILSNTEGWYSSPELLLSPKLRQYNIPYIHSITEFTTVYDPWFDGLAK